jgi:osmotically-inducible protein OsmY
MKYLVMCLSIAFAVLTAACAPTQTSRGTAEVVDDATLTAKVKTQIAQTQGLGEAASINVDTYRGVVSLAGFVDSAQQARTAAQVAGNVEGVKQVKNNLQVKPRAPTAK